MTVLQAPPARSRSGLPPLPDGWHYATVESACETITVGIVIKPAQLYRPDGVRCFRSQNIRPMSVNDSEWVFIDSDSHNKHAKSRVRAGDVLIVRTGLPGVAAVVPERYDDSNCIDLVIARPLREWLLPHFLAEFLNSPLGMRRVQLAQGGLAQQHLNVGALSTMGIELPPVEEQQAIARVSRVWQRAVSKAARLLHARRRLRRALLQQLLTGEYRFAEFQERPWDEVRVGDVLQETSRLVEWDDSEMYRLASIRRGSRGLFDRGSLHGRDIKVKKLHVIREGDFLISHIQAAYGAMGTVPEEFDGAKVSDMYSILTPKTPGCIDMRFVNYLSQRKEMRHMAYLSSNGFFAERLRLNFDPHDFLNRKLLLPPTVEEQSKIADVLETLDREIELLTDLHVALQEQKKGLMQQLLTGKVRVPESMLEPQEVS